MRKLGYSWVICHDVALQLADDGWVWQWFLRVIELRVRVLNVDIVAHTDKLLAAVRACQQKRCDPQ